MRENVGALKSLIDAIQQSPAGMWFVGGDDPEMTVADAATAVDAILALVSAAPSEGGEGGSDGGDGQAEPRLPVANHEALQDLLRRVESATGADRELDTLIAQALAKPPTLLNGQTFDEAIERFPSDLEGIARHWPVPEFTASLDAALALLERVLPGWSWGVSGALRPPCDALLYEPTRGGYRVKIKASGATPALALLAALLAALLKPPTPTTQEADHAE